MGHIRGFFTVFIAVALFAAASANWVELDCYCTTQYNPICASDMIRYSNGCTFKCRQRYLEDNELPPIFKVDCKLLPSLGDVVPVILAVIFSVSSTQWYEYECYCTPQYDPVCASDRMMYKNYCTFQCRLKYLQDNKLPLISGIECRRLLGVAGRK